MSPVIETEGLILRPYTEADIPAAFALFEQDAEVYRFDPGFARTLEQRDVIVTRLVSDNEPEGEGTLAVTLKESGRMIGQVGLQLYVLPWEPFATPEAELYYKFGAEFWGAATRSKRPARSSTSPSPTCACFALSRSRTRKTNAPSDCSAGSVFALLPRPSRSSRT